MKRYIATLLVVAIAAVFSACGCARQVTPTPGTEDTTPTVTLPDPTSGSNIPDPTVNDNSTENGSLIDDITEMTEDHNNG